MGAILKGKEVGDCIKKNISEEVLKFKDIGVVPTLAIVRLGKNQDDLAYERNISKICNRVGIFCKVYEIEESISTEGLFEVVNELNNDKDIHGILIFRPLPEHIDEDIITNTINPLKDVDCMNPVNLIKIFEGSDFLYAPCTPEAVIKMMEYYDISLEGANVVIVNRSMVVGKPLAMLLLKKNATVTICHSKTKNLKEITRNADIIVTALGSPKYFNDEYFNENSIVIDVGISSDENGDMCGDVDFDSVKEKVNSLTPVPGGVGSVTTSILLNHVIVACKNMK